MRKSFMRAGAIALVLGSWALPVWAMPDADIKASDTNGNGVVDRGDELDGLLARQSQLTAAQKTKVGLFLTGDIETLKVADLIAAGQPQMAEFCREGKRFHLQESVGDISVFDPNVVTPSRNGALLSYSDDRNAGDTTWELKGAIAWVATNGAQRCLLANTIERPNGARLSGFGIAPFLSFDGKGSASAGDVAEIKLGVLTQWQFFGGVFDLQEIGIAPFYQTDLDGDAEIYGLSATWKPYHFESRLNGLQGDKAKRFFDWSLVGTFNYLSVEKAGTPGLTTGDEHAWAGVDLGAGYTFSDVGYGLRLSAGVNANYDFINEDEAILFNASARLGLGKDARAYLELRYENGTEALTLRDIDETKLNLRFAF